MSDKTGFCLGIITGLIFCELYLLGWCAYDSLTSNQSAISNNTITLGQGHKESVYPLSEPSFCKPVKMLTKSEPVPAPCHHKIPAKFSNKISYQEKFIKNLMEKAQHVQTDIPLALIISQACLETGYGRFMRYKNLFCMTGSGPAGHYRHGDHDWINGKKIYRVKRFRAYYTFEQSIKDLNKWYLNQTWYQKLKKNNQDNLPNILNGLKNSGYATDPGYINKLKKIIKKYHL